MKLEVVKQDEKQRLDKYIAKKMPDLSRMMVQKLIEEGNIQVNQKKIKPSYLVQAEDNITIELPQVKETNLKAQDIPLNIIYEDNDIIVVNKEKGMVVHPANRQSRWNPSKRYYGTLQGKFIWNRGRIKTRNCTPFRQRYLWFVNCS